MSLFPEVNDEAMTPLFLSFLRFNDEAMTPLLFS